MLAVRTCEDQKKKKKKERRKKKRDTEEPQIKPVNVNRRKKLEEHFEARHRS